MKVAIFDRGVCGIEQTFYLGTVNKDTDAAEGTHCLLYTSDAADE